MNSQLEPISFTPIGVMRTVFSEKFGTPRQSLMVTEARGVLKLKPEAGYREALNHLSEFSHVWIVFVFDQHLSKGWRSTIRPPRIQGPRRVGVFASRSPHRPNPIGLSAVKLERIDLDAPGGIEIHLSGVDILDGTPVLDIKPYLPYADSVLGASGGWADGEITRYSVELSSHVRKKIASHPDPAHPNLEKLIAEMLEWDPRPRSQRKAIPIEDPQNEGKVFRLRILDFDVEWEIHRGGIRVLDLL